MKSLLASIILMLMVTSTAYSKVLDALYRESGDTWKYAVAVLEPEDLQYIPLRHGQYTGTAEVVVYEEGLSCEVCITEKGVVYGPIEEPAPPVPEGEDPPEETPVYMKPGIFLPRVLVTIPGVDYPVCFNCFKKRWFKLVEAIQQ